MPSLPTSCGGSARSARSLRQWAKRSGCDGRDASSEPRGFEPCGERWSSMARAQSTSPCRGASRTPSSEEKGGLNAMSYVVSTFVSPTWSARPERLTGEQGGEQRGGTGGRVRCSPLAAVDQVVSAASWQPGDHETALAKPVFCSWLWRSRTGGGLCRPLTADGGARRSQRQPWRERPRVYTACAAKPAASAWSLTPRLPVTVEVRQQRVPWAVTAANTSLHLSAI